MLESFSPLKKHLNVILIGLIGTALSVFGYLYSAELEAQKKQSALDKLIGERQALLQTEIATTIEILDAVASYISNTPNPTEESYRSFINPILKRHPEFWAVHWAPRVLHDQRPFFEEQLKNLGYNQGITELQATTNTLAPSSHQEEYYPVLLTQPLEKNRSIIGFNVASRKINKEVMIKTLSQDIDFLSSAPFKLVQDNEGSASVLFFRPVFRNADIQSVPLTRFQTIRGYIVALVKPQTILDILSVHDDKMAVKLSDLIGNRSTEMANTGQDQIGSSWLSQSVVFESLGRLWQLELSVSPKHPALMDHSDRAIWVLIGGLGFTFILAMILLRLSKAQRDIIRERDRAQSYLDTVETMMMVLDTEGRITMINRKGCEILGYEETDILHSLWYSPRYISEMEDRYQSYLKSIERGYLSKDLEYTENAVLDSDGNHLIIAWHNKLQFDDDGNLTGMLSAGEDITQKHYFSTLDRIRSEAMQSALEGSSLNKILDKVLKGIERLNPGSQCSILLLDDSGQHLMGCAAPSLPEAYNQAIDGVQIGDGVGSCGTAAFHQKRVIVEDIQTHPYWAAFKELAAVHSLGSCWSEPIFGKKGRLLGTFAIYHENACSPIDRDLYLITRTADFVSLLIEEQQTEANLHRLATTDELTSLANRRKFLTTLEAELARAKRYHRELSLCMLDLDHFKRINDDNGHSAGDSVLVEVAKIMEAMLRESDMAGRIGGEEFAILLPDTSEDDALILAERLREAIESLEIKYQAHTLKLTTSIGVASLNQMPEIVQASELLSAADDCMYYAKQNGRNLVSNVRTTQQLN
ncbi:diguanylate cyclase [Neptuniibacter caesariensis]|uniref:diguanylate cyclase n=1 Tax=Neptuniibacter caesariensis TaxID=207954 RepID=A0A7U8C610_NEPCE|nr:diguanylate cyclase [Neptuniibacter caesariensis]EAR61351.1 hypothetical protein MED92_11509 [Oceanospirillum sp. MED92] [Neptuniibacter caesariensis]